MSGIATESASDTSHGEAIPAHAAQARARHSGRQARPAERWRRILCQAAVIVLAGSAAGLAYNLVADNGIYATAAADGEIGLPEAKRAFDEGMAVFVDARFAWDFAEGHVPGARNVPIGQLAEKVAEVLADLSPNTWIITYCSGEECHSSHTLARLLRDDHGFRRVQVMTAGWPGWVTAGYPVESGQP